MVLSTIVACMTPSSGNQNSDTLIIQIDTRSKQELANYKVTTKTGEQVAANYTALMRINANYAAHHGYDYQYYQDVSNQIPPYWIKVFQVNEVLMSNASDYKYILYIDTDAVIQHSSFNKSIHSFFDNKPQASFMFANEPNTNKFYANTGVWMLKKTPETIKMMNAWSGQLAMHYISAWTYRNDSSQCQKLTCHNWICTCFDDKKYIQHYDWPDCGGPHTIYFDDGFFEEYFLKNDTFGVRQYLSLCPWHILNNHAIWDIKSDTFINHFYGANKVNIARYLKTVPRELYR